MRIMQLIFLFLSLQACKSEVQTKENLSQKKSDKPETQLIKVNKSQESITIDGKVTEKIWNEGQWHIIDRVWRISN